MSAPTSSPPTHSGPIGLAGQAEHFTRSSVQIATKARDKLNPYAYVAGSVAPSATQTLDSSAGTLPRLPGRLDLESEIAEHPRVVADAGADLLLLEFFDNVADTAKAVTDIDLPIFLGLCQVTVDGAMRSGESFEQMAKALIGLRVDAVMAMCSDPEGISASLPKMRKAFDLPLGAYANLGYKRSQRPVDYPQTQFHVIDSSEYPPARYAEYARRWRGMGAQIVGGCCGSGPEHIAALREPAQIQTDMAGQRNASLRP